MGAIPYSVYVYLVYFELLATEERNRIMELINETRA